MYFKKVFLQNLYLLWFFLPSKTLWNENERGITKKQDWRVILTLQCSDENMKRSRVAAAPKEASCNIELRELLTCPANIPHTPMMHRMLNTAEPTMVPTPTSPCVMNTPAENKRVLIHSICCHMINAYTSTCTCGSPIIEANSSGAELPAAMKVAPATSSLRCSF